VLFRVFWGIVLGLLADATEDVLHALDVIDRNLDQVRVMRLVADLDVGRIQSLDDREEGVEGVDAVHADGVAPRVALDG
jgi:aryl carrier-like protein